MKLFYIQLVLALLALTSVKAQNNRLNQIIDDSFNRGGGTSSQGTLYLIYKVPEAERALLFSIIIQTGSSGEVTDVSFTNSSPVLDSVISKTKIISYLKKDKNKVFLLYKNAYIVAPILIRDIEGRMVETDQDFLKSFDKLIPLDANKAKRVLVLPTRRRDIGAPQH